MREKFYGEKVPSSPTHIHENDSDEVVSLKVILNFLSIEDVFCILYGIDVDGELRYKSTSGCSVI